MCVRVRVRVCDGVLYFSTIILLYQFSLPLSVNQWEGYCIARLPAVCSYSRQLSVPAKIGSGF